MSAFSLLGLAAQLHAIERDTEVVPDIVVAKAARIIQKRAKDALGTYEFDWPRLTAATIARKKAGDSPLLESGALRGSIEIVHGHREAWVGTNSPYAAFLEYGTSRMPPRPFMDPAAQESIGAIKRMAQKEMAKAVGGRGASAHRIGELIHLAKEIAHLAEEVKEQWEGVLEDD